MKANYDPEVDALYLSFGDVVVVETEEVKPGIILDFDADGGLVGIEVLDASTHVAAGIDLSRLAAA